MADFPKQPSTDAPEEAWLEWVNRVAPQGGPCLLGDPELALLCRYPDRLLAARAALQLVLARGKHRSRQRAVAPEQRSLWDMSLTDTDNRD